MECTKAEFSALEQTVGPSASDLLDLDELELALVGGGVGEVIVG